MTYQKSNIKIQSH